MTRSHRQFGPCCNALAMGVVLSASFLNANAQVLSPPVSVTPININPLKPQITGPAGVQGVTQSQNTTATLRWFQPVLSATRPNARDASYFVVCLLDVASNCTYGPAGTGIWIGAATNSIFSRTAVTTGSPFTTGPNIIRGYNYSLTVTLNNSFYNRRLAVSVGACATQATSACTFATPLPVAWSSVDLVAENTGSIPNSMTEQHFYAEARNQGTGDSG